MHDSARDDQEVVPGFGRWTYDVATDRWWWSDEMITMYASELANPGDPEKLFERAHPEDTARTRVRLERALTEGRPMSGQARISTITRGECVFAFLGDPQVGPDGSVTGLVGYVIDITDDAGRLADEAVVGATEHRAAIEQVKGALMSAYQITDVVAFETLRRYSMLHNVKLATLAHRVVERMSQRVAAPRATDDHPSPLQLLDEVVADLSPTTTKGGRKPA